MTRKQLLLIFSLSIICIFPSAIGAAETRASKTVRIAIISDGPWVRFSSTPKLFKREIVRLTEGEFDAVFIDRDGGWSEVEVKKAVHEALEDTGIDMVITLGAIASDYVCRIKALPKPVIAPIVIDYLLQQLPIKSGASGVPNLNYLTSIYTMKRDVKTFLEIVPFKKLTVLVNEAYVDALPKLIRNVAKETGGLGIDATILPVAHRIQDTLESIPEDTEAVLISHLLQISDNEFERLLKGLKGKGLPSFSRLGYLEVKIGAMAGILPEKMILKLARRTALNAQRILRGEEAGSMSVSFFIGDNLAINMATARAVGVYPTWVVLGEAELIDRDVKETGHLFTLTTAVRKAIEMNLDLVATGQFVLAGSQNIRAAKSTLLPQFSISTSGNIIDDDRAEASFGTQAERSLSGSAKLSQIIYSEKALSNIEVQKRIQTTRERDLEIVKLDIVSEVAVTYLNLLKAKTFEKIRKDNLKLSKSNLELARIRKSIGISGPEEVYRWESEVATDRIYAVDAESQRNIVEQTLNRLLHRPLEEPFSVSFIKVTDRELITRDGKVFTYTDNPRSFALFRDFMVKEGISNAPELKRLGEAIVAKARELLSAKREYYHPTVTFQASLARRFAEEGEGTEPANFQAPISFPERDDTDWNVGINLTLPLYEGGSRSASVSKASVELSKLKTERRSLSEKIEQRIRAALHKSRATRAAIGLSRKAAGSAQKNLNLIKSAYSKGAASITDLLSAQNAALVAGLGAANAEYDFLIDLVYVERAIAKFAFLSTEDERDEWFERLDSYMKKVLQGRRGG